MLVYVGLCYTLTMDILLEKKNMNLELALNRLTLPQKSANIFLQYIFGRLIKLWFLEKKKVKITTLSPSNPVTYISYDPFSCEAPYLIPFNNIKTSFAVTKIASKAVEQIIR